MNFFKFNQNFDLELKKNYKGKFFIMSSTFRIIPRLDIKGNELVKGIN